MKEGDIKKNKEFEKEAPRENSYSCVGVSCVGRNLSVGFVMETQPRSESPTLICLLRVTLGLWCRSE